MGITQRRMLVVKRLRDLLRVMRPWLEEAAFLERAGELRIIV